MQEEGGTKRRAWGTINGEGAEGALIPGARETNTTVGTAAGRGAMMVGRGMIGMGVGAPRAAEGPGKSCLWAASLGRTAGGGAVAAYVARLLVFACPAVLCGRW